MGVQAVIDWKQMTPAEVLDAYPALRLDQVAYVIGAMTRRGEPDRRHVVALINAGRLRLINPDPNLAATRWTVSQNIVRGYLEGRTPMQVVADASERRALDN